MKKLILVAVAALLALTAHAQFYVGGQVGLRASSGYTNLTILPEVGYNLNENMSIGTVIGYDFESWKDTETRGTFEINPYFRYSFLQLGHVSLFADAQLQLALYNSHDKVFDTKDNSFSWGLGIAPGLAIPVSENLSFVGHLGRVGYYNDTFELGVNGNYFTVGAYYSF